MSLNRREFLHVMSLAAAAGMLPGAANAMSGSPERKRERTLLLKCTTSL